MKKALIVIDYQYDFVADDGKLTIGAPAQQIAHKIAEIAEQYDENDIYFTLDDHKEADWDTDVYPETTVFPKHCITGTKGHDIYGNIKGSQSKKNYIYKHAYLPDFLVLNQIVGNYDEITLVGVVTHICVFQTAIGLFTVAVNSGKKIKITVDSSACASFDDEQGKWALDYLKNILNVNVI